MAEAERGPGLRISRPYFTTPPPRRGENIISGSEPFLIFRLHYNVLRTSWVANSIANALNATLLRSRLEGAWRMPIHLNFCSNSIWEIVRPAALAKLRRQFDCTKAFNYVNGKLVVGGTISGVDAVT